LLMGLPSQNKPFLDNIKVENRQKKLLIEMWAEMLIGIKSYQWVTIHIQTNLIESVQKVTRDAASEGTVLF
jgi:hypothetical protein